MFNIFKWYFGSLISINKFRNTTFTTIFFYNLMNEAHCVLSIHFASHCSKQNQKTPPPPISADATLLKSKHNATVVCKYVNFHITIASFFSIFILFLFTLLTFSLQTHSLSWSSALSLLCPLWRWLLCLLRSSWLGGSSMWAGPALPLGELGNGLRPQVEGRP